MTRLRLPALLLAGLTLAGCGSEPAPDQLAAPAVLPASPSGSAGPVPVAAAATAAPSTEATEKPEPGTSPVVEGDPSPEEVAELEQFVRDYYAAVNAALETGDVASVEAFSIPECTCRAVSEFIGQNFPLGVIEGSRSTVHEVGVQAVGPEWASIVADVSATDGRVVGADGATLMTIDNGERGRAVHALLRTADGWRIGRVIE